MQSQEIGNKLQNMRDNKKLFFVQTLDDIRSRLKVGDSYNLIRIAGLLRQLFFDGESLIDAVNKDYKMKLEFLVNSNENNFDSNIEGMEIIDSVSWRFIYPLFPQYSKKVSKNQLVKLVVLQKGTHDFSVKQLIKYTANLEGGIHFGRIDKKDESAFKDMNDFLVNGRNLKWDCLKSITEVVIMGLDPLKKRIKS